MTRRFFAPPAGAPPSFYRDVILSMVAAIGFVFLLTSILDRKFDRLSWLSGLMLVTSIAGAKRRSTPCVTALLFGALRLGIAGLISGQAVFLVSAAALAIGGLSLFQFASSDSRK